MRKLLFDLESKNKINLMQRENRKGELKSDNTILRYKQILNKTRSKEYLEECLKLDLGDMTITDKINNIKNIIANDYPEVALYYFDEILACVSMCYLEGPYVIHTVDFEGNVIVHYKSTDFLSSDLEKAKSLILNGGYELVEIYKDSFRAISKSGIVSFVSK